MFILISAAKISCIDICLLETSKKFSLRFVKHFQFHIIAFVNMECKENDVNDADIDHRFPTDIEKAANRATLTFINK
jgi:hypothetical protein